MKRTGGRTRRWNGSSGQSARRTVCARLPADSRNTAVNATVITDSQTRAKAALAKVWPTRAEACDVKQNQAIAALTVVVARGGSRLPSNHGRYRQRPLPERRSDSKVCLLLPGLLSLSTAQTSHVSLYTLSLTCVCTYVRMYVCVCVLRGEVKLLYMTRSVCVFVCACR